MPADGRMAADLLVSAAGEEEELAIRRPGGRAAWTAGEIVPPRDVPAEE
jgi:hypothetical protein